MGLTLRLISLGDKVKVENDDRRDVASIYCLSATIAGVEGATDKLNQGKE